MNQVRESSRLQPSSASAVRPISVEMERRAGPPADLFDEAPPLESPRHVGAIAPLSTGTPEDRDERYLALRWRAAGVALVAGGGVAALAHFPEWAVAALALFSGGMSLWPLPRWWTRIWLIAAASFVFAQSTTIFVDIPFTWPMRFGFCAAALAALAIWRAVADD